MRPVIVVPTYNEAAALPALLAGIEAVRADLPDAPPHLLVVDDNSPDGTADIVRDHAGFGDWITLLSRTSKDGLGAAYRAGFGEAMSAGFDAVVQMDADGSHPMSALPAMFEQLRTHDVVIGSRYVAGGATERWPLRRRVLSSGANLYTRRMLALTTRDATSGFRAWRTDALVAIGVLDTESNGYGFQVENTWRAERVGLRVTEHPITFVERVLGDSKMSPSVAVEAASLVLRWRLGELGDGAAAQLRYPSVASTQAARALK